MCGHQETRRRVPFWLGTWSSLGRSLEAAKPDSLDRRAPLGAWCLHTAGQDGQGQGLLPSDPRAPEPLVVTCIADVSGLRNCNVG